MTDAHPAGTYTVTVKALNGGGSTAGIHVDRNDFPDMRR